MEDNNTTNRINLFDFDEVLAHSCAAVEALKASRPEVASWRWWHDEALSTEAALITEAIEEMWDFIATLDGEHWILTARNGAAVEAWLAAHGRRDVFVNVISTSREETKDTPAAIKKTWTINEVLATGAEVHFYDDAYANIAAAKAHCPGVITHHVTGPARF